MTTTFFTGPLITHLCTIDFDIPIDIESCYTSDSSRWPVESLWWQIPCPSLMCFPLPYHLHYPVSKNSFIITVTNEMFSFKSLYFFIFNLMSPYFSFILFFLKSRGVPGNSNYVCWDKRVDVLTLSSTDTYDLLHDVPWSVYHSQCPGVSDKSGNKWCGSV